MKYLNYKLILLSFTFFTCNYEDQKKETTPSIDPIVPEANHEVSTVSLVVLGTLQDAGSPHIGCKKDCCASLFETPDPLRQVVSMGVIDPNEDKTYLFEATPDFARQVDYLQQLAGNNEQMPDGIFLTHAHIGHYTGLMYLGKEAINASNVPVFAMPRMKSYLTSHGPWSQLITQNNIELREIRSDEIIPLTPHLSVTPFQVPHRDEFSETVGYRIQGPTKSVLFIPDIDKWGAWSTSIIEAIANVDYAFIDATFYSGEEIDTRDISEIPHPFIIESLELFKDLPPSEKQKIHFIHFNHTNPLLDPNSAAYQKVIERGFRIAKIHQIIEL